METLSFNIKQNQLRNSTKVKLSFIFLSSLTLNTKRHPSDVEPNYVLIFNLFLQPVPPIFINYLFPITRPHTNLPPGIGN